MLRETLEQGYLSFQLKVEALLRVAYVLPALLLQHSLLMRVSVRVC